jgi:hypothetical protein
VSWTTRFNKRDMDSPESALCGIADGRGRDSGRDSVSMSRSENDGNTGAESAGDTGAASVGDSVGFD